MEERKYRIGASFAPTVVHNRSSTAVSPTRLRFWPAPGTRYHSVLGVLVYFFRALAPAVDRRSPNESAHEMVRNFWLDDGDIGNLCHGDMRTTTCYR